MVRGTSNTISVTPFWTATKYNEAYSVYIDYNQNGVFTDTGEKVWTKTGSKTTPATGSFTVPATATLGATRMRVMMKYSTAPTSPCGTYTYGQVEDYTVNITATAKVDEGNTKALSFGLYPNPVTGDVLNITNLESAANFRIYNLMGQQVAAGKIENNEVHISALAAGAYIIEVSDENSSAVKRFVKK